jgi:multidrug resistance efflux pump
MLIVLSFFALIVWLVFFKFQWLPWNKAWKTSVYTLALIIALVVVGALKYYTPVSQSAVVAAHTQHIYPLVSGQVIELHVQRSASVKQGDPLFTIDPRPYQYAVDNWVAAERLAKLALDDAEQLVAKGAIARFARDERSATYDQAVARLANARYELENTVISAPGNGFISLNVLHEGQVVSPSSATMTFIDTDEIWITALISQNGLNLIEPGAEVYLSFSALPGEIFTTTVEYQIPGIIQGQVTIEDGSSPGQAISNVQDSYPLRITFPADAPENLRNSGKLASATIFADAGNPINVLAKLLAWISTWLDFL